MDYQSLPRIKDIEKFSIEEPWNTKVGGELFLLNQMSYGEVQEFLSNYDSEELNRIPRDIRGIRAYFVKGMEKNSESGLHFHRLKSEKFFCLEGEMDLNTEDLFGNKESFKLDQKKGIYLPPFIFHTTVSNTQNSNILVLTNTLFYKDDPRTHDTYGRKEFDELQNVISKHL